MERFQPIYDIAELCSRKGIQDAILSPGSRCAPLTLAFTRHSKIRTKTISDERSAGFIGLGIAQQTNHATILLCTSGTAAYNFAPAVAEAFFSKTPLIVFTADRPAEWIGQQDGQTIYQQAIFGKHVKKSFELPQEYDHPDSIWAINRSINDAINLAMEHPQGPVHINVPLREPLYPAQKEIFQFSKNVRVIESIPAAYSLSKSVVEGLKKEWTKFDRILIVCGQQQPTDSLLRAIKQSATTHKLPVAGDVLSNLHSVQSTVQHADLFLGQASDALKKSLQPDLLITFGGSLISKNLKLFLRNYSPKAHWHIQPAITPVDTFQHLTKIIHADPSVFFELINSFKPKKNTSQSAFLKAWQTEENRSITVLDKFFLQSDFGELELVKELLHQLPKICNLHLANSMSVRYANFIGLQAKQKKIRVFANRGTSGIDGCTSTAVGHALAQPVLNILITGDMAFFYDRNAFWNLYPVPNLRVVVLNNHGGIIFKMIDGPASLSESDEYFVTHQQLTAKKLCEEFGFEYIHFDPKKKDKAIIKRFLNTDRHTKILELETGIEVNISLFEKLKQKIKKEL